MTAQAQSNSAATDCKQAVQNFQFFEFKQDSIQTVQDSLYLKWEKRIEKMKLDQKKREEENIKPE